MLVLSIAAAIGLEIVRAGASWGQALRARLRPLVAGTLVLAVVAGPFFARNVALYGQAAPTAYEGSVKANQASYEKIPYLERRPLAFTFGWNLGIYGRPFFTTGLKPEARFFPVLIASTFNDYYVFSYWGGGKYGDDRWVPGIGVLFGIISNLAGTAVSLVTVIAWLGAVRTLWRRREDGTREAGTREAGTIDPRFALLLMPLGALLGQLHFATKYPNDNFGPIKGAYLQFVAPVLCALFGVGVDWMWRRRARWAGARRRWPRWWPCCASPSTRSAPACRASARTPTRLPPSSRSRRSDDSIAAVSKPLAEQRFLIVGGAGFIGSHFFDRLLARSAGAAAVTLYDNFSSGREWHYAHHANDSRLRVVRGDVEDTGALAAAMAGHDVVIHLASNPDIARAATEPDDRLLAGDGAHPQRARGDAHDQRQADPLRLGQRRLRRSRRRTRRPRTTGRSCRSRPTAPASSPARR